jgi:hypothetical protein
MMQDSCASKRKIKRPVASDLDGTQQGGLAFCVALLGGTVSAASLAPGSLTSFWMWFALLMAASAIAAGTERLFAQSPVEKSE